MKTLTILLTATIIWVGLALVDTTFFNSGAFLSTAKAAEGQVVTVYHHPYYRPYGYPAYRRPYPYNTAVVAHQVRVKTYYSNSDLIQKLPAGCHTKSEVNNVPMYRCNGVYYKPVNGGFNIVYVN